MRNLVAISIAWTGLLWGSAALAQQQTSEAVMQPPPEQQQQPWAQSPPPQTTMPPPATDGVRFRGAIVAAGGAEFISNFGVGMGGVEGRLGVQINNLIGIYVQPSLAFGGGSIGNIPVVTGTFSTNALIDFTFADRFFFGVGGGFGILNNPIGPDFQVRVGAYPIMSVGRDGYSRSGLVVSADARLFILFDRTETLPVMQIMGCIGYEVF